MKQFELAFCALAVLSAAYAPQAVAATDNIVVRQDIIPEQFHEQKVDSSLTTIANGKNGIIDVPVISWRDMPFQTVKKQALDYSCGSAAISTLLTYIYGFKTPEKNIFKAMFESGDKNKIRQEGFSLLDMSEYLNRNGFKSVGYKLTLDVVEKSKVPFIGLINDNGYNHFVVVKSINGSRLLVGDPNKGNVIYKRAEFEKMWNGVALIITNYAHKARQAFGDTQEWEYAHNNLSLPSNADFPGIDSTVLSPLQWQIAPSTSGIYNPS